MIDPCSGDAAGILDVYRPFRLAGYTLSTDFRQRLRKACKPLESLQLLRLEVEATWIALRYWDEWARIDARSLATGMVFDVMERLLNLSRN